MTPTPERLQKGNEGKASNFSKSTDGIHQAINKLFDRLYELEKTLDPVLIGSAGFASAIQPKPSPDDAAPFTIWLINTEERLTDVASKITNLTERCVL